MALIINSPECNMARSRIKKLKRPVIDCWKVIFGTEVFILMCGALSVFCVALMKHYGIAEMLNLSNLQIFVLAIVISLFIGLISISDTILIGMIVLYQKYAPAEVRLRCHSIPSCSTYGILAIRKYGSIIGVIFIIRRLLFRCGRVDGADYP